MKKTNMITKLAIILATMSVIFTGCSQNNASQKTNQEVKKLTKIQYGFNVGTIMTPLIVIADKEGLFKKEGLDVDLINVGQGAMMAVDQGKIYGYPHGVGAGAQMASQKSNVVFFGGSMNAGSTYIARAGEGEKYKDLSYFKGKKMGVVRLIAADLGIKSHLMKAGVDPNKDVKYVELPDFATVMSAVKKGDVDIGSVSIQQGELAREQGLDIAFYSGEVAPDYVCCKQVGNAKYMKEHREVYVALMKAQIEAYKIFKKEPERVTKMLAQYSNQSEKFVYNVLFEPKVASNFKVTPDPYANKIREYYKDLEDAGLIKKGVNINDYIDVTIYQDALNKVIEENPNEPLYKEMLKTFKENNF